MDSKQKSREYWEKRARENENKVYKKAGDLDVHTYVCRGKVFANVQTGNIVLFGISLIEKKWWNADWLV